MTLIEKALALATRAHEGQKRKSDGSPYIAHPIAVAQLLKEHGFGEEVQAAALVHDVLEDTNVSKEELRSELGEEVLSIVEAVSEDKSLPWEERKQKYIEAVQEGSEAVKAVSIADKIHNAQSLLAEHMQQGREIWKVFNRSREQKLWFESEMLKMFKETWPHPLVEEYAALVEQLKKLD